MRKPAVALAALALVAGACSRAPSPARPTPPETQPRVEPPRQGEFDARTLDLRLDAVASGLDQPLLVTAAPDGSGRIYVAGKTGRVYAIDDGRARTFLDITDRVGSTGYEQGLLGLAFHPGYATNRRLFVNYTDAQGDTVVSEFRAGARSADPGSERVLLRIDQPFENHNGGHIVFGPDRYLWIGTGDGGSGGDPEENAQDLGTLLGKMLRIDVDRGDPYAVPPDNPFAGREGARREIWAFGLRNPWRFSFDLVAARLWIADVGQGRFEEVNRAPVARAGLNYGWDILEGRACFEPESGCDRSGTVRPVATYPLGEGRCAVIGGHVYRGRQRALQGAYLFADFCSGDIWALDAAGRPRQDPALVLDTDHQISSFGVDEEGEIYLTDLGSGEVLRLVAR